MSEHKTADDFKKVELCDFEAIDPYHDADDCPNCMDADDCPNCMDAEKSYFWADEKGELLRIGGRPILAPRPDGKCYCGVIREKCGNFVTYGEDCQGFKSTDDKDILADYKARRLDNHYNCSCF